MKNQKLFWILRGIALVGLLILLFRPEISRKNVGSNGQWAFLMDTSSSMAVKDSSERLEKAKEILQQFHIQGLTTQLFQFSEGLNALDPKSLSSVTARGVKTNLAQALTSIPQKGTFPGAIIFTDGRQVGPGDPVSAAAAWGKPLFLIGMGSRTAFKDAAVRKIQAPPFAFKNIVTQLSAVVTASGLKGQTLTVTLSDGNTQIKSEKIIVSNDDFETTVPLSWRPDALGEKRIRVTVESVPGEITVQNNRQETVINVGRDRFRVLYLCGAPGPEYNFLRYQLKSDPAVELVTFVILRNAGNMVNVPEQELSLIPFPTQDMLINQLPSFDVVIFEEFSFWEFGLTPALLQAIRRRVETGGSFLMLAGPKTTGPNSLYGIPEILPLLPVQLGQPVEQIRESIRFRPRIPGHPILRLEPDLEKSGRIWNSLPAMDGLVTGPVPKPGTTVVADADVNGKSSPVLVVQSLQKGRSAILLSRTSWRWSMIPGASDEGGFVYSRFWKNMILWLTRAEENKIIRLGLEQKLPRMGEPTRVRVWIYDDYFKPLPEAEVRLQVKDPAGVESELTANRESEGVYSADWTPSVVGSHRFQVFVKRKGVRYGEDSLTAQVVEGQREDDDLRPDFTTLQEMANVSGGAFTTADEFRPEFISAFEKTALKSSARKILLWNSPWLLGMIVFCLGLEWFLRKKAGLP